MTDFEVAVSIIIPIYQKEKYLRECIQCLQRQTFSDFEIICVDDASVDNSFHILQELSENEDRIRIIRNKKNKGAAYSRNKGIEIAKGEYLLFLDADDLFEKEMVEKTLQNCRAKKLDVLMFDYSYYGSKTSYIPDLALSQTIRNKLLSDCFTNVDIQKFSFQICSPAPWRKMYRREFVLDNDLRFQNLSNAEDVYFSKLSLLVANRIGYLDKKLVKYRITGTGHISNNIMETAINCIKAIQKIKKELEQRDLLEKNKESFYTYALKTIIFQYYLTPVKRRLQIHETIIDASKELFESPDVQFLNSYFEYWLKDFICTDKNKMDNINNEYKYIFEIEKEKVYQLQQWIKEKGSKVALWGYGKNGKALLEQWKYCQIPLSCIIDSNPAKVDNQMIFSPDIITGGTYCILVTNLSFVKEILERVHLLNDECIVIDLQSYFTYGFSLGECVF